MNHTASRIAALFTAFAACAAPISAAQKTDDPCGLVTQAEMRAILHAGVTARNSHGKCIYTSAAPAGPYAEIQLDRGDGAIAMRANGAMAAHEPGISNPLAGLGDQATQVGTAFMVRVREDLLTIVFSGVDARVAKAKKIVALAKPRL